MKTSYFVFIASLMLLSTGAAATPRFAISCNVYEGVRIVEDNQKAGVIQNGKRLSNWEPLVLGDPSYPSLQGEVFERPAGQFTAAAELLGNGKLELRICKGAHFMGPCDDYLARMFIAVLPGREVSIGSPEADLQLRCLVGDED